MYLGYMRTVMSYKFANTIIVIAIASIITAGVHCSTAALKGSWVCCIYWGVETTCVGWVLCGYMIYREYFELYIYTHTNKQIFGLAFTLQCAKM